MLDYNTIPEIIQCNVKLVSKLFSQMNWWRIDRHSCFMIELINSYAPAKELTFNLCLCILLSFLKLIVNKKIFKVKKKNLVYNNTKTSFFSPSYQ